MFLGERVCGTITVGTYHADVTYTPEHLAILQSFANQTAAAIQHVGRLEQAERLRASAVVLSGQHTTAGVIKAIVEQGHYLIGSDITDLVIHEPDGSLRKAQMVAPQDKSDVFTEPRQQGGLTRYVVDQKKTVVIPDTSEHALIKDLVTKAGIRSVLAMPLMHDDRVLAVLFAHTYKQRFFDEYDLSLWTAFASQAAIALWNALDEEIEGERLNRQLRALVRILQASRKGSSAQDILDQVAVSVQDALGMDICSVLEYDSKERAFCRRGAVGLRYPKHEPTLSVSFRTMFLDPMQRTEIPDVRADLRMRNRSFTHREEIASVFIFPLHVEQEPLGLLFANYRHPKKLTAEELDAISIFADMAALVIRESRLRNELVQIRERLDMRVILTRMSIMEDAWRHSVTTKAATIRIQAMLLKKGIERSSMPKQAVDIALRPLVAIDALAAEIARTQPRLPQSWELEPELVPLATLLEDTYKRQSSAIEQEFGGRIEVRADFEGLDGLQVRASRRWLIFALESVFDNAKKAMPEGGVIRFSARRSGRRVEVRVSDTGKGMSAELRGKLFKEVIPKSGLDEGQGIGSMLTAIIVRELGGTIELEPAAVGTTVLMRLPVTVVE
jgi:GAF domain-containing protein